MLYWRLLYPGDIVADEPDEQCSIGLAPHGASVIVVTQLREDGQRYPIAGEPLNEDGARRLGKPIDDYMRAFGASPWMPVFYRKKSIALAGKQESQTDAVVFGRGCILSAGKLGGAVWMVGKDGAILNCPPWAMDLTAITSLVEAR